MDVIRQLLQLATSIYREMSVTQRVSLGMMVITVSSLLLFVVYIGSAEESQGYVALPVKVEPADSNEIIAELDKAGYGPTKYDLDSRTLSVPVEMEDKAVILLAGKNLLQSDSGGFAEWIDKRQFHTTSDHAKDMMRVALQNEMARLISSIDVIREAKVIYTKGKSGAVFRPDPKKRASVYVKTKLGQTLSQEVAQTIIRLVSAAQTGMDPQDVQLTDQNGRRFSLEDPNSMDMVHARKYKQEQLLNSQLQKKLEDLCRNAVPNAQAYVYADHQLLMDKHIIQSRKYLEGPRSSLVTEKISDNSNKRPAQEVGTRPNIGRVGATGAAGVVETHDYNRKYSESTYNNGVEDVRREIAPKVESLTVSVALQMPYKWKPVLDENGEAVLDEAGHPQQTKIPGDLLTQDQLDELELAIRKASGMVQGEENREVEILQVAWQAPLEPEEAAPTQVRQIREWVISNILPLMMIGVLLMSVLLIYSQAKRSLPSEEEHEMMLAEGDQKVAMLPEMSDIDQQNASFESLRNKVADVVAEDPRKSANLVRKWMTQENY